MPPDDRHHDRLGPPQGRLSDQAPRRHAHFYEVHPEPPLRGAVDGHQIGELIRILLDDRRADRREAAP